MQWTYGLEECRICGYRGAFVAPVVCDIDNMECANCHNMSCESLTMQPRLMYGEVACPECGLTWADRIQETEDSNKLECLRCDCKTCHFEFLTFDEKELLWPM
jgi:ssDNA-binding Zn-finger/Zn-ribbon topoisomerase 1